DQAVHAAGNVQADDQIDVRRLGGFVRAKRKGKRGQWEGDCESRKNAYSKHGVTSAAGTNDPPSQKTSRATERIHPESANQPWKMDCIARARTHPRATLADGMPSWLELGISFLIITKPYPIISYDKQLDTVCQDPGVCRGKPRWRESSVGLPSCWPSQKRVANHVRRYISLCNSEFRRLSLRGWPTHAATAASDATIAKIGQARKD